MGRTNPTYRDFLERYEGRFGDYRRALRREARGDFDRLFERARAYADAAGYANHLDRDRLVLLSMVLGHEAALRERQDEIDDLAADVAALADEVATLRADLAELREAPAERRDQPTDQRDQSPNGDVDGG